MNTLGALAALLWLSALTCMAGLACAWCASLFGFHVFQARRDRIEVRLPCEL